MDYFILQTYPSDYRKVCSNIIEICDFNSTDTYIMSLISLDFIGSIFLWKFAANIINVGYK